MGDYCMTEFKTKEVAQVLKVSEPSVRNYAKMLEKYGHDFIKRRQARIWTDKEISLIREILNMYEQGNHELETCFQYVVAKKNVGEEKASELLENPLNMNQEFDVTQLQQVENNILQAIVSMKDELKEEGQLKIEYKQESEKYISEIESLKNEIRELKDQMRIKEREYEQLDQKYSELNNEVSTISGMNIFEFRKYKKRKFENLSKESSDDKNTQ